MPLPRQLAAFNDVKQLIDSCINQRSEATLNFPSSSAKTRFRQRFYHFRKLLLELNFHKGTPYDQLILRNGDLPTQLRVEILDARKIGVTFDDPSAVVLPLESPAVPVIDGLFLTEPDTEMDDMLAAAIRIANGNPA